MLGCGNREHREGSMCCAESAAQWRLMPKEAESMYTYCVFCLTQKCTNVAIQLQKIFGCKAIRPKQEQLKWVKHEPIREIHDLLPGYVFLYSEHELEHTYLLREVLGVIRCLSDLEHRYILQGNDEAFALMLYEKNGVIGKTKVYEEGERIRICDGAYAGLETNILKVNRRNMRMLIQIPFAGMQVETWVEYEMVKPADQKKENEADKLS